jgi:ketosteroid isomerase-like protein
MNKELTCLTRVLLVGLLACAPSYASDADRAELQAAIHRWAAAVEAQDVATMAATMTDDVELSEDATTVKGRDAAIRALRNSTARGRWVATSREITVAHGVAWHLASLARKQKNGVVQAGGQCLEIWTHVGGHWKLHRRLVAGASTTALPLERPPADEPVLDPRALPLR